MFIYLSDFIKPLFFNEYGRKFFFDSQNNSVFVNNTDTRWSKSGCIHGIFDLINSSFWREGVYTCVIFAVSFKHYLFNYLWINLNIKIYNNLKNMKKIKQINWLSLILTSLSIHIHTPNLQKDLPFPEYYPLLSKNSILCFPICFCSDKEIYFFLLKLLILTINLINKEI